VHDSLVDVPEKSGEVALEEAGVSSTGEDPLEVVSPPVESEE